MALEEVLQERLVVVAEVVVGVEETQHPTRCCWLRSGPIQRLANYALW